MKHALTIIYCATMLNAHGKWSALSKTMIIGLLFTKEAPGASLGAAPPVMP